MRVPREIFAGSKVTISISIALALFSVAQASQRAPKSDSKTRIKNFGCVNETLFRGAQPKESDYPDLAAMGVKTVIDLQRDGDDDEQRLVEAAGMSFHRFRMSDKDAPTSDQVAEVLKLVNDPANQPVFVHCKGGRHRTGLITAVYRMTHDAWTFDKAYAEMKQYDFEYGFGHGPLRNFVYAFYSHLDQKKDVVVTNANN